MIKKKKKHPTQPLFLMTFKESSASPVDSKAAAVSKSMNVLH